MTTVRLATSADLDRVVALLAAFRDFLGTDHPDDATLRSGVTAAMADGAADYLIADDPDLGAGIGVVQFRSMWSVWHNAPMGWVEDVFVTEACRGHGIGKALMTAAIGHARRLGCARLHLDANSTNSPALALYRSLGFSSASSSWGGADDLFLRFELGDAEPDDRT